MERLTTLDDWRHFAQRARDDGRRVGLVATMGALHEGHLSMVRRARESGDVVVLTSFVNPRQFSDARDLATYPHTPIADADLALDSRVDALVTPSLQEMWPEYPAPTLTTVSVSGLGDRLEGEGRRGHFDGVASVVAKLLIVTGPCRAYFGEKDYQQLVVVRRMVRDLAFDVQIVGCAIERGPDGLALSSRNARLSPAARVSATSLHRALEGAQRSHGTASQRRDLMADVMGRAGIDVAYADVVDVASLESLDDDARGEARAVVAGVVEGVRLIDNAALDLNDTGG
ncbi:MAG TPA: pantoate--beta-alanine ligase [Acidimicrobiales bacterium]